MQHADGDDQVWDYGQAIPEDEVERHFYDIDEVPDHYDSQGEWPSQITDGGSGASLSSHSDDSDLDEELEKCLAINLDAVQSVLEHLEHEPSASSESASVAQALESINYVATSYLDTVESFPQDHVAIAAASGGYGFSSVSKTGQSTAGVDFEEIQSSPRDPAIDLASEEDLLLDMMEENAGLELRIEIEKFSNSLDVGVDRVEEAQECLDLFLHRNIQAWSTHDTAINDAWEEFVEKVKTIAPTLDFTTLSKPSGPLKAALSCIWAYPTFSTKKKNYGHTMDKTNPCIRGQYAKLGSCARVRTQDRFPIRESHAEKGVRWSEIYDNWEELEKECSRLSNVLNRHSRFLVFLGLENFNAFESLLGLGGESGGQPAGVREVSLHTLNPGVAFYRQPFKFAVVREKDTKKIVQVVWFSYHLQHFFYNYRESPSRYFHDFLWNGICELSRVPIKDPFCFSKSSSSAGSAAFSKTRKHGTLATALLMRMYEKGTGSNYPEAEIRHIFRLWIEKDPKVANATTLPCDPTGSFLAPLLRKKAAEGGRTAGKMSGPRNMRLLQERWRANPELRASTRQNARSRTMTSTVQAYQDQLSLEKHKHASRDKQAPKNELARQKKKTKKSQQPPRKKTSTKKAQPSQGKEQSTENQEYTKTKQPAKSKQDSSKSTQQPSQLKEQSQKPTDDEQLADSAPQRSKKHGSSKKKLAVDRKPSKTSQQSQPSTDDERLSNSKHHSAEPEPAKSRSQSVENNTSENNQHSAEPEHAGVESTSVDNKTTKGKQRAAKLKPQEPQSSLSDKTSADDEQNSTDPKPAEEQSQSQPSTEKKRKRKTEQHSPRSQEDAKPMKSKQKSRKLEHVEEEQESQQFAQDQRSPKHNRHTAEHNDSADHQQRAKQQSIQDLSDAAKLRYSQLSPDAAEAAKQQFSEARFGYQEDRKMRQEQQTPNDADNRLAQGAEKGRDTACQNRRDRTRAQAESFLSVLQVRRLCAKAPASLDAKDRRLRDRILELQQWLEDNPKTETMPTPMQRAFKKKVQWYDPTKDTPNGLRFERDNGPDTDDFPYETEDHPYVHL